MSWIWAISGQSWTCFNMFSWLLNDPDFSWEIRLYNFLSFIVLNNRAKFRKKSSTRFLRFSGNGQMDQQSFSGSAQEKLRTLVHAPLNFCKKHKVLFRNPKKLHHYRLKTIVSCMLLMTVFIQSTTLWKWF